MNSICTLWYPFIPAGTFQPGDFFRKVMKWYVRNVFANVYQVKLWTFYTLIWPYFWAPYNNGVNSVLSSRKYTVCITLIYVYSKAHWRRKILNHSFFKLFPNFDLLIISAPWLVSYSNMSWHPIIKFTFFTFCRSERSSSQFVLLSRRGTRRCLLRLCMFPLRICQESGIWFLSAYKNVSRCVSWFLPQVRSCVSFTTSGRIGRR